MLKKTDKTQEIERRRVTSGYHGGSISGLQQKKKNGDGDGEENSRK